MIVRISGVGQFELNDTATRKLDELDTQITDALNRGDEAQFTQFLQQIIDMVRTEGMAVPDDTIVPSDVKVPPEDTTLEEARSYFTDEGLMAPLPA